jgi:putative transposase
MNARLVPLYGRHRFPAEVIGYAVWLYFRFPLNLRMVEEMLAARGIDVSHESVRHWAEKFGREYSNRIRRRAPARGDKWHMDEVVITIRGRKHWLWRAVDQQGFVLDILVQSRREAVLHQVDAPARAIARCDYLHQASMANAIALVQSTRSRTDTRSLG